MAGDRTMYPPVRGDGVAREEMQREIVAADGDRRVDVRSNKSDVVVIGVGNT